MQAGTGDGRTGRRRGGGRRDRGQAIVEFAIAGTTFFLIVFGTIDFGRVVFMYAGLQNAVREGARYGQIHCTSTAPIIAVVKNKSVGLDLSAANAVTVTGVKANCAPPTDKITVNGRAPFRAVTQTFLGIAPITLKASSTVYVE